MIKLLIDPQIRFAANYKMTPPETKISGKAFYVKFETPKELSELAIEAVRQAKQSGKVNKGTNETTKAIERGLAKLVIIAEDVEPPEVVAHLPILCEERSVPYIYVQSKAQMGPALGMDVGAASVCILESGEAESLLDQIFKEISGIKKG